MKSKTEKPETRYEIRDGFRFMPAVWVEPPAGFEEMDKTLKASS